MPKIYTNKHNLPESYVNAVKVDKHRVYGDISVTQLIDSPQIRVLRRQHDEVVDVKDMLWALFGTALHSVLERSEQDSVDARTLLQAKEVLVDTGDPEALKVAKWLEKNISKFYPDGINTDVLLEHTMTVEYLGWTVSGTCDKFTISQGLLEDYKSCSTYEYINPESRKKWDAQQNIYAHMLRSMGYDVQKAQIVAIFKNWSRMESLRNKDYPPLPIMSLEVSLFPDDKIKEYIIKRVKLHQDAEKGAIPECTGKERWAKADSYAIIKEGGKRAIRVLETEAQAKEFIRANEFKYKEELKIEYRPGEDLRCTSYCPVSQHCSQFKNKLNKVAEKQLEINKK